MFKIACGPFDKGGWGQAPSEFWSMTTGEWWLMYDAFVGDGIKENQQTMRRLRSYFND